MIDATSLMNFLVVTVGLACGVRCSYKCGVSGNLLGLLVSLCWVMRAEHVLVATGMYM